MVVQETLCAVVLGALDDLAVFGADNKDLVKGLVEVNAAGPKQVDRGLFTVARRFNQVLLL